MKKGIFDINRRNAELKRILDLIPRDEENAIHLQQLCMLTGFDQKKIKLLISRSRNEGHIIVSGQSGYWKTSSREDLLKYIATQERQALTRLRNLRTLKAKVNLPDNQEKLDL